MGGGFFMNPLCSIQGSPIGSLSPPDVSGAASSSANNGGGKSDSNNGSTGGCLPISDNNVSTTAQEASMAASAAAASVPDWEDIDETDDINVSDRNGLLLLSGAPGDEMLMMLERHVAGLTTGTEYKWASPSFRWPLLRRSEESKRGARHRGETG